MSCDFSVLCRQHTSCMGFCSVDWSFSTSGRSCVRRVMACLSVGSTYKRELCVHIVHTHLSVIIPASHQHSEPVLCAQTSMDFEAASAPPDAPTWNYVYRRVHWHRNQTTTSYNNGRMLAQVYAGGNESALTAF
jgi:hypothetical protein